VKKDANAADKQLDDLAAQIKKESPSTWWGILQKYLPWSEWSKLYATKIQWGKAELADWLSFASSAWSYTAENAKDVLKYQPPLARRPNPTFTAPGSSAAATASSGSGSGSGSTSTVDKYAPSHAEAQPDAQHVVNYMSDAGGNCNVPFSYFLQPGKKKEQIVLFDFTDLTGVGSDRIWSLNQCKIHYDQVVGQPLNFISVTPHCWDDSKGACTTTNAYLIVYVTEHYSLFQLPTYDFKKGPDFWQDYPTFGKHSHDLVTFQYSCKQMKALYGGLHDFWMEALKKLGPIMAQDKAARAARMASKHKTETQTQTPSSSSGSTQLNPPHA